MNSSSPKPQSGEEEEEDFGDLGQEEPSREEGQIRDQEDSEEEEEETSERESRPKKRRKRTKGNRFIDIEAEVDEEDEDEEEDDVAHDGFIANGGDDDVPDEQFIADSDKRHREYDRQRLTDQQEDLHQVAAAIDQRERRRREQQQHADEMGASGMLPRNALMPDIEDPTIWAVKVKLGRERDLVAQVSRKGLATGSLNISSCFCRDSLKGFIYVEARSEEYVRAALQGMVGVYNSSSLLLVPLAERADLLTTRQKKIELKVGGWVRFKRPQNLAGDIGQIFEVPDNADFITIKFIPRIDLTPKDKESEKDKIKDDSKKRKKSVMPKGQRPPQAFFNPEDVKKVYGNKAVTANKGSYFFANDEYTNGFCVKDIRLSSLEVEGINPTIEEVTRFADEKNNRNRREDMADDQAQQEANKTDSLNLAMIAEAHKQSARSAFQPGDSVKIVEGLLKGIEGTITSIINDKVTLVASPSLHPDITQPIETTFMSVRKQFQLGDHVKVLVGKNADETGLILAMEGETVNLLSDLTGQEISVFAKDIREAAEVGGGINQTGDYELHDFVLLDEHTAAVIFKVERNILRVVDQANSVRSVAASAVRGKVPQSEQSAATDSNGQSIAKGDAMRESQEHVVGREPRTGSVLHIYKGLFAFLFNRNMTENGGVFVVYAQYLISEAARVGSRPQDSSKMNPNAIPAPMSAPANVMGSAAVRPRRDILQGKRIVCGGRGTYKGKEGIVLDIAGEWAWIELSSSNLKIKLEKNKLFVRTTNADPLTGRQQLISALDHYKQRDLYGPKAQPAATAGGMGGKTPNPYAVGGGRTPNPYANAGGRTVNPYAAGGGKTPAYNSGSATPYGAGDTWSASERTPHAQVGQSDTWNATSKTPRPPQQTNNAFDPSSKTPYSNSHGQNDTWSQSQQKEAPTPRPAAGPTPRSYSESATPASYSSSSRNAAFTPAETSFYQSAPTPANAATPYSAPTPAASSSFVNPARQALMAQRDAEPVVQPKPPVRASYERRQPNQITGANTAEITNSRWGKTAPSTPAADPPTPGPSSYTRPEPTTPGPLSYTREPTTPGPASYTRTPAAATPGVYSHATPAAFTPAAQTYYSSGRRQEVQPSYAMPTSLNQRAIVMSGEHEGKEVVTNYADEDGFLCTVDNAALPVVFKATMLRLIS